MVNNFEKSKQMEKLIQLENIVHDVAKKLSSIPREEIRKTLVMTNYHGFAKARFPEAFLAEIFNPYSVTSKDIQLEAVHVSSDLTNEVHYHRKSVAVTLCLGPNEHFPAPKDAKAFFADHWSPYRAGDLVKIPTLIPHGFTVDNGGDLYFLSVQSPPIVGEDGQDDYVRLRGELSPEHAELLTVLEKQYPDMVATLKKYELIQPSLPSWEQIKNGLNAAVLEKARQLEEPTLVIVPPVSRQAIVEAINAHKVNGQEYDTHTYDLGNDDLWSGGKPEGKELPWEVSIVTGAQEVKVDKAIIRTNYQIARAWVKKYEDQRVDVINDARTYLVLMMRSLTAGKPVDKQNGTVLNAKNLTESSLVADGFWRHDRVRLHDVYPHRSYNNLRVRGLVKVM